MQNTQACKVAHSRHHYCNGIVSSCALTTRTLQGSDWSIDRIVHESRGSPLSVGGKMYDHGSQIKIAIGTDEEIKVTIRLAVKKGWQGLHLTGSDEFKSQLFLEAVLSGSYNPAQITGDKSSKRD
ncbi:LPD7 domain-containing protein [Undibacterium sp. SXout20W]|uniref:LPD7 domain-containing protein n=1 Tax=Undibacterium sp. SXout20W TaxID=3413051 RepID=UPI003BF1DF59